MKSDKASINYTIVSAIVQSGCKVLFFPLVISLINNEFMFGSVIFPNLGFSRNFCWDLGRTNSPTSARRGDDLGYIWSWVYKDLGNST